MSFSLFWLKKAAARLLFPMPLAVFLLLAGLVLMFFRRRGGAVPAKRRLAGAVCAGAGTLILLAGSYTGTLLLGWYAGDHRPLKAAELGDVPPEGYLIAVTSAGYNGDDDVSPESHRRLREGYRLAREFEKRRIKWRLLLAFPGNRAELANRVMQDHNRFFEISAERVSIVPGAANSLQEVGKFAAHPGRLILVSSPWHLPRLLHIARLYGVENALASATEKPESGRKIDSILVFFPNARSFARFETLIYELLGRLELTVSSLLFSAPRPQQVPPAAI